MAAFSQRLPASLARNQLTTRLDTMRVEGRPICDLTMTNPIGAGVFDDATDALTLGRLLAHPALAAYHPEPRGLRSARCAVADQLPIRLPADQLLLTASTSEAYSLLFKLLADPGDAVLLPRPSYPLFDHLTALDAVRGVPYALDYAGAWMLDLAELEAAHARAEAEVGSGRVRALLLVNPNNPTGHGVDAAELEQLTAFCAARDLALISDEVFFAYTCGETGRTLASACGARDCLTFTLGGLSKLGGLPQLKLGWIATTGPSALVGQALERLDVIADAYLSVAAPVQLALPELFELVNQRRQRIQTRRSASRAALATLCERFPEVTLLTADGGWSAVLRLPELDHDDEALALAILDKEAVLLHPGYFFDFPRGAYLVVSLLTPPDVLRDGLPRALAAALA
jgi:alanine-synthesizing transaminase